MINLNGLRPYDVGLGIVHDEIGAFCKKGKRVNEYLDILLLWVRPNIIMGISFRLSVDVGTYGFVGAVQDENGNWQVKFKKGSDIIGKDLTQNLES